MRSTVSWDSVSSSVLEVLVSTRSDLPVEPAKRCRQKEGFKDSPQAAGRRGRCGIQGPPGAKLCAEGPGARPIVVPVWIA